MCELTDAINFTEKFAVSQSYPSFTFQGEANLDVLRFVIYTRGKHSTLPVLDLKIRYNGLS